MFKMQLFSLLQSSRYPVGPTETERCIESLLAVFQRYAGKEGNSSTLSKKEFKTFMDTELGSFTKVCFTGYVSLRYTWETVSFSRIQFRNPAWWCMGSLQWWRCRIATRDKHRGLVRCFSLLWERGEGVFNQQFQREQRSYRLRSFFFFYLLQSQKDPGVVDRMMKKLDMNNDGQLDFSEFLNLIGGLASACHEHMASAPVAESHRRP